MSQSSWASVSYINASGDVQTCDTYTSVTSDSTSWTNGWYVVDSNVTIDSRITASGTVNLILADDFTLTAPNCINVAEGNSLTIYGQSKGTGTLTIDGVEMYCACIGGGEGQAGGNIIINGGTVNATNATGTRYGAGIGGGYGGAGGNVTINGGTVNATNATGSGYGAGIGGGFKGAGGTITINGGNVTATGNWGAGIGGGYNGEGGTITINGGTVTATGGDHGAGIGGGFEGAGGTITLGWTNVSGDSIYANSYNGTVTLTSGFLIYGADTETTAIPGNIDGKKIVPSTKVHALTLSADTKITVVPWEVEGRTVTLSYTGLSAGYRPVYSVNGSAIEGDTFTMPSEDVTITVEAIIPIVYTITYDLNDGALESDNPATYTVESDDFKLTNPTRTGYTFDGWTGTSLDVASTDVTISQGSIGNRSYSANWTPITYTITYSLNGGTASNPATYTIESEDFKLTNPTRTGYTFTGWTLSGDENIVDSDDLTVPAGSIGDRTYIAGWNIITYTITYNLNGGTADNPTSYTVETDTFTLTPPKRKGFMFEGWTGTNLTEATASVTITQGSTGDREYSATWMLGGYTPEAEETPEFVYHQLILSGQLNMMFYVYIPDELSPEDCTMDFAISGDTSQNEQGQKYAETITENDYTLYGYQCYFSSVQMADEIHATLHYGDSETLTHSYTVKTYLDLYADNENISDDTRELARSIKDYGSYVQPVLAENNGWVIGVKHAKMDAAHDFNDTDFNNVITDTADDAISYTIPEGSGISAVNYTLLLDAETTIEVYLTPADGYTGTVVVYVDGGSSNMAALEDGRYVVSISDIPAHRLAKKHTLKVVTGNVSFDVKVSALSYVHDGIRKGDDNLKRAVTSLYRYWDANMTYRHNRPDEYQD